MFTVPDGKKIRLIIDSDAKNEADDAYAIVHALLTPKFVVKGIIGAHYGTALDKDSMNRSVLECEKVVHIMGAEDRVPVVRGGEQAYCHGIMPETLEGADFIIQEAMSDDRQHPLFVIFLGPITDLAMAYEKEPAIADRMTAIWVGGGSYPAGCWEFNLSNDIEAANIVFQSPIPIWQIPMNAYCQMLVSMTELEERVYPQGAIGKYLFEETVAVNDRLGEQLFWPMGESWSLGDSTAIGLMLDPMFSCMEEVEAPEVQPDMSYKYSGNGRKIRVYNTVNPRFILEDFFWKLKRFI